MANVALAEDMTDAAAVPDASAAALPAPQQDPGDLTNFRDEVGKTLVFTVTGATSGSIWGEGIYTDDSNLATAAVHAGVLKPGETRDVKVQILPGQKSYKEALDFAVHAAGYGPTDGAYKFLDTPMAEAEQVFPDPGTLADYRSKIGKVLQFAVTGSTTGSVWGDGTYTDDSDLDTAAVHAGLVKEGENGTVAVRILQGQGKYRAAARNGVTSSDYGKFDGSFQFVDAKTGEPVKAAEAQ
jgi:hypothetical protein